MRHLLFNNTVGWLFLATLSGASLAEEKAAACNSAASGQAVPTETGAADTTCDIEVIEVKGRFIGFEVPEVAGRVQLNRDYISRSPKSSGDINELISRLAGVQASEQMLAASQLGEIRALELSISGGQPWQTGFFIDGVNFNSRIDPGSSTASSLTETAGVAQAFTVNSRIVEQVTVYDSNIPVEYGAFSGGVVDVSTRAAKNFSGNSFGFEYRRTNDSIGDYHLIEGNPDRYTDLSADIPNYDIQDLGLYAVWKLNNQHSLLLNASYTESQIDELSLGQYVATYRENYNVALKYSMSDVLTDRMDFSLTWAPYRSSKILPHVLGSRYTDEQGGLAAQWQLEQDFSALSWRSQLAYSSGENSRQAPQHYKPWALAKGRSWGELDPGNDDSTVSDSVSVEGHYGSLDKQQQDLRWLNKFVTDNFSWAGMQHQLMFGAELELHQLQRQRQLAHYRYGGASRYSSNRYPLQCNGFYLDCIELSLALPLSQLEQQLGGSIDFSNPEHLAAYEANVVTSAQYFALRQVYAAEDITLDSQQLALFAADQFDWHNWQFNLGLRYSYDDFFQNHNIAPRVTAGYRFDTEVDQLISLGLSRYYDANLLTYKLREQETPYYVEYRPLHQGVVQNWLRSGSDSDFRYRYDDVRTPYNDEIALAYKLATANFGTYAVKAVKRFKRDQLASAGEPQRGADGYYYRAQNNSASGEYQRVSLSWHLQSGIHSWWANLSWQDNYVSAQSYDENPDTTPLDELIALSTGTGIQLLTLSEVTRRNSNFSRPVKLDLGLTSDWSNWFDTALTLSYVGGYNTVSATGGSYRYQLDDNYCAECEITDVMLPLYSQLRTRQRILADLSLRVHLLQNAAGHLVLKADIQNVFNQRTYLIAQGQNGIERGRQIWLGVEYNYD